MSRTFRRKRSKKHGSRFEKDYTDTNPNEWCGINLDHYNRWWFPKVPLEGRDFDIAYWKYHSDSGHSIFGWENAYETPMREMEYKRRGRYNRELLKWSKDHDYEIIFQKSKQIWDYC